MRTKKLFYNTLTSLLLQFTTLICGFILPRFMLGAFGSEVNGAVSSISNFLGYISILEAGVGGVTRAALYKPLADRDNDRISGIINATQGFFQKIAYLFVAYAILLAACFKYVSSTELGWLYTAGLVLILAISTFSQYYFGITYSVLLNADQSNYIGSLIQIGTMLLNTALSVLLIRLGLGVHAVKLASAGVYVLRPILLNLVVRKKFRINKAVAPDTAAIRQRWNGFGHHIAFYIHNNIDMIVVTTVLGLKWASVYSVYAMILMGIKNLVNALSGSSEAAFGDMIAKNEKQVLHHRFGLVETLTSVVVSIFFTTAGLLIFDFVDIYTADVRDMTYVILPVGILFAVSEALHCIKQNYHSLVLAAGHFKQTQRGAFIEAGINVVLSVALVFVCGLSGILIATIASTCFRMIEYIIYLKTNILHRPSTVFWKRIAVNLLSVGSSVAICLLAIPWQATDYVVWVFKAILVFGMISLITLVWNFIFYRRELEDILKKVISFVFRHQRTHNE